MEKMQNSAGNATQEMEKIYDSLEYKLNSLQETWTGVTQNLLDDSLVKGFVDILTFLSEIVDKVTGSFGLLGTIGFGTFGVELRNLITSAGGPNAVLKYGRDRVPIAPAYALVVTRNELAA